MLILRRYGLVLVGKLEKKVRRWKLHAVWILACWNPHVNFEFWCYFGAIMLDTCWWLCVVNISQKTFVLVELKWDESEDEFWKIFWLGDPTNVHVLDHNFLFGSWNQVLFVASENRLRELSVDIKYAS